MEERRTLPYVWNIIVTVVGDKCAILSRLNKTHYSLN